MNELDLHGVRHKEAKRQVEDFFASEEPPFKVITGNSPTMKRFVEEEAEKYEYKVEVESYYNLGALIVNER